MAYIRKTRDEYDIEMYTPYGGWEIVDCHETRKEALQSIKDYRVNQSEYDYRIKHHRVKIGA